MMRRACNQRRISPGAPIYAAAVMEYIAAEILELAGNATRDNNKTRINGRFINLAIQNDDELVKMFGYRAHIAGGGVIPNIHNALLPKKKTSQ